MKLLNILFPVLISFFSCSKAKDYNYLNTDRRNAERVRLYLDHYTKDTVFMRSTLWYEDYLSGQELMKVKSVPSVQWLKVCLNNDTNNYFFDKHTYVFGNLEYKPIIYK